MMKVFLALLVVCALAVTQVSADSTTTDFCSSGIECCQTTAKCLKYLNYNAAEGSGLANAFSCPHPSCPLGWSLSGGVCKRTDDTIVGSASLTSINSFTSIANCLLVQTSTPQSYHTRHCIEGLMQTKRACLFNLGLKG